MGKVVSGMASASGNQKSWGGRGSISLQINMLRTISPELTQNMEACVKATINVSMQKPTFFKCWEYTFEQVFWLPDCTDWSEKLAFTPIVFCHGEQKERAWLYKAYRSPHINDQCLLEVIAPPIEELCYGNSCALEIGKKYLKVGEFV